MIFYCFDHTFFFIFRLRFDGGQYYFDTVNINIQKTMCCGENVM